MAICYTEDIDTIWNKVYLHIFCYWWTLKLISKGLIRIIARIKSYTFFLLFIVLQLSQCFSSLPSTTQLTPSSLSRPCPWAIYTCSLTNPFPFFPPLSPYFPPLGCCQSVSCFHVCGSILLNSFFWSLDSSYK